MQASGFNRQRAIGGLGLQCLQPVPKRPKASSLKNNEDAACEDGESGDGIPLGITIEKASGGEVESSVILQPIPATVIDYWWPSILPLAEEFW